MVGRFVRIAVALVTFLVLAASAAQAQTPFVAPVFDHFFARTGFDNCAAIDQNGADVGTFDGVASVTPVGNGDVRVNVFLLDGEPNTTYTFNDACHRPLGSFTTNAYGTGSGTAVTPQDDQTDWVIDGGPLAYEFDTNYYYASSVIVVPPGS
jgi:hypothetical protein